MSVGFGENKRGKAENWYSVRAYSGIKNMQIILLSEFAKWRVYFLLLIETTCFSLDL